jgi:simple sugar transport system ATP-binding protein
VVFDGKPLKLRNPRSAIAKGIAFTSEDRKAEGLVADLTVRDNLILAMQAARGWARQVPKRTADELVKKYVAALDIRPADPDAVVGTLSGGNQQKVLLARWLVTQPRLLILDEPTRGIDVGAKAQIQKVVADLAADGMAVVFISAELEEVVRVSDRVVVLRDRRKIAELDGADATVDDVVALIAGEAERVPS